MRMHVHVFVPGVPSIFPTALRTIPSVTAAFAAVTKQVVNPNRVDAHFVISLVIQSINALIGFHMVIQTK